MGRIKTTFIKTIARELFEKNADKFSEDFGNNKKEVDKLVHIKSKKHQDDVRLILQVHDELVYEVKNSLVNEVVEDFKKLMEGVLAPSVSRGVPIVAEAQAGENWGEMQPFDHAQDKQI